MTMEILIQRQNSLKTKIKTMLMQQNVTCEQNLDKDTFAAMENMIKISNTRVSPCSISLPDDLDKEYHILTKECRKIKNSAVGTISKLKNAEKTLYYKIVKDLLGQLKKKICALMGDDADVSETATDATTPTTTTDSGSGDPPKI
uniref:Uncharacterized protein n=1 Tax=Romanomermis culicivorax TaxID=13658 RepID=A0A915JNW7_ROMCU